MGQGGVLCTVAGNGLHVDQGETTARSVVIIDNICISFLGWREANNRVCIEDLVIIALKIVWDTALTSPLGQRVKDKLKTTFASRSRSSDGRC